MAHFDEETFAELVAEAIDSLPQDFRRRMENVTVEIEPLPDRRTCREMELDDPHQLLGLYRGVPLTNRSVEAPFAWPDSIVIYQESIEAASDSAADAVGQIRRTVLHEIGHFFGLDEADLDDLGFG